MFTTEELTALAQLLAAKFPGFTIEAIFRGETRFINELVGEVTTIQALVSEVVDDRVESKRVWVDVFPAEDGKPAFAKLGLVSPA